MLCDTDDLSLIPRAPIKVERKETLQSFFLTPTCVLWHTWPYMHILPPPPLLVCTVHSKVKLLCYFAQRILAEPVSGSLIPSIHGDQRIALCCIMIMVVVRAAFYWIQPGCKIFSIHLLMHSSPSSSVLKDKSEIRLFGEVCLLKQG